MKSNNTMSTPNKTWEGKVRSIADYLDCNEDELVSEMNKLFLQHKKELMEKIEGMEKQFDPETKDVGLVDPFQVVGYNKALREVLAIINNRK